MPATTPIEIFAPLLIPPFFVARTESFFPTAGPFEVVKVVKVVEVVDVVAEVLEAVGEVVVCRPGAILEEFVDKVVVVGWVATDDSGDADNSEEVDAEDSVLDDEVVVAALGPSCARKTVLTTDCPERTVAPGEEQPTPPPFDPEADCV